jgi:hypothetical protein
MPSPVNGESSSTARISRSNCPSAIAPSGLDRPSDLGQPSVNAVVDSRPRRWSSRCDGPALDPAARRSMALDVRPVFPVPPGTFRTDGRPLRVNPGRAGGRHRQQKETDGVAHCRTSGEQTLRRLRRLGGAWSRACLPYRVPLAQSTDIENGEAEGQPARSTIWGVFSLALAIVWYSDTPRSPRAPTP